MSKQIPEIFADLFREVPPEKIMWRLSNGTTYTAEQLIIECGAETEVGRIYMSEALRVVRDLISRQARQS